MAEQLAGGNAAVALLANTGATVAVFAVLIAMLGPISGAHFNPVVSLVAAFRGELPPARPLAIFSCKLSAAVPARSRKRHVRSATGAGRDTRTTGSRNGCRKAWRRQGWCLWSSRRPRRARQHGAWPLGSVRLTGYGLHILRQSCNHNRAILSDTFAGIRPVDVPWFILAQVVGGVVGLLIVRGFSRRIVTSVNT